MRHPVLKEVKENSFNAYMRLKTKYILLHNVLYMPRKRKNLDACLENAANYEQIPTNLQKYIFIFSNENDVIHVLANYVHNSLKIRESVV